MDKRAEMLMCLVLPMPALLFVLGTTPLVPLNGGLDTDGRFYAAMALRSPGENAHLAPWCWRILTPCLASTLPFGLIANFKVLAFFSNWLSLVLIYLLLRRMERPRYAALLGTLLYAGVFWTLKFSFYSPTYIDYQTQTFLLAALYLMVRQTYGPIPILLAVGVLQKETLLLLGPVVYVHYARTHGWGSKRSLLYLTALLLLPFLAHQAVQSAISAINRYSAVDTYLENLVDQTTWLGFWPRFLLEICSGLGLLPCLVLYRAREAAHFLRRQPEWAWQIGIGVVLLFGGIDKARLFLFMLPALIVVAAYLLDQLQLLTSVSGRAWIAITVLLHLYIGHYLTPMGTFARYLARMVPIHATTSVVPTLLEYGTILLIWASLTALLARGKQPAAELA